MATTSLRIDFPEITDEESAYAYAARMQAFINAATNFDTTATALQRRIVQQLRAEGLDEGGLRGLLGSNARGVARRAVAPLRAASADAENVARAGALFRRNMQNLVFEPIREARRQRKSPQSQGLGVH